MTVLKHRPHCIHREAFQLKRLAFIEAAQDNDLSRMKALFHNPFSIEGYGPVADQMFDMCLVSLGEINRETPLEKLEWLHAQIEVFLSCSKNTTVINMTWIEQTLQNMLSKMVQHKKIYLLEWLWETMWGGGFLCTEDQVTQLICQQGHRLFGAACNGGDLKMAEYIYDISYLMKQAPSQEVLRKNWIRAVTEGHLETACWLLDKANSVGLQLSLNLQVPKHITEWYNRIHPEKEWEMIEFNMDDSNQAST